MFVCDWYVVLVCGCFFFFKQKTAYEMRISDWSSDVCSSDLLGPNGSGKSTTIRVLLGLLRADTGRVRLLGGDPWTEATELHRRLAYVPGDVTLWPKIGSASCREGVCQYV